MAKRAPVPDTTTRKAGRPPKFGQPGRLVALTLPQSAIRGLQRIDPDLGWAIVQLLEGRTKRPRRVREREADLVLVGRRQALIIVDPAGFGSLPGIQLIPFGTNQAFVALEAGGHIHDLADAVRKQLQSDRIGASERQALLALADKLTKWQNDSRLRFETRAILVAETAKRTRSHNQPRRPRR